MSNYKTGVSYFPFDVGLLRDKKLIRLKIKHGHLGMMVYICLLCIIYEDKGYYLDYSDKETAIWQVLELLNGKNCPEYSKVEAIINEMADCGLLEKDLFPHVLTSKRIQKTFFKITADRKSVNIDPEIWLLSEAEMLEISSRHPFLKSKSNDFKPKSNGFKTKPDDFETKKSKVKKSKVKNHHHDNIYNNSESKKKLDDDDLKKLFSHAGYCFGRTFAPLEMDLLKTLAEDFGVDSTVKALTASAEMNARSLKYTTRILENWRDGKTPEDFKKRAKQACQKVNPDEHIMKGETNYNDIYKL